LLAARLDVGQLELLAEDLRELGELDVDLEEVLARSVARARALAGLAVAADRLADLAVSLADAALLLRAVLEAGELDLREGDRDEVLALLPEELSLGDVLAQLLLDLPAHDLHEA